MTGETGVVQGDGYADLPGPGGDRGDDGGMPAFTDFGWAGEGRLDLRVFSQDVWWVDYYGRAHRLEEMSPQYRANVLAFLQRYQGHYFRACLLWETVATVEAVLAGRPSGELLVRELGGPLMAQLTPGEWLEATPLMRRLR